MKGAILAVLIITALLVVAQDSPGLDPELSLEPKQKLEDGTPNGDFKDASPPLGKPADEFPLETPKATELTSLPEAKVDQLEPTPGTVDQAVAATQVPQQDEQLTEETTDSNAAEEETDAVDGTHMEVMTEETPPPPGVTAAQEVKTVIEPPPSASNDSPNLDTTTIVEPEDITPTATTTQEIMSVLDSVPATTFAPHGTQPLMISTIQPMVSTVTDRDDLDEVFVKPIYADKSLGQDVTTSAPAEEVTSYQPNPKIWKPTAMAMDAHKEKRKQPRDAVDPSIPQMAGNAATDQSVPQMPGNTANQGQATRMNETAHHHAHGEHAGEGQNANVAPSMKAFFGVSAVALAVAFR